MEFTKKDMILSLIFPVITAIYGVIHIFGGTVLYRIAGAVIIGAAVIVGVLIVTLKINTSKCLKVQTITLVVTFWLHVVAMSNMVTGGDAGVIINVFYEIFFMLIDVGSIVLMMFKLPEETALRQRMIVFFSNPILYYLILELTRTFWEFLWKIGLIGLK